jgi:hypothetical protein
MILDNEKSFEHWMRLESIFAQQELDFIHSFDFKRAGKCRKRRQQCLDLALDSFNKSYFESRWRNEA